MPCDTSSGGNSADEHAQISEPSKQNHRTHEKLHEGKRSRIYRLPPRDLLESVEHAENSDCERKQKANPIQNASFSISAPGRRPRRRHHVNGQYATEYIVRLVFHVRKE